MRTVDLEEKERCLRLMEQFKTEVVSANAPDDSGKSTVASAVWADSWLQALDVLGEIDSYEKR